MIPAVILPPLEDTVLIILLPRYEDTTVIFGEYVMPTISRRNCRAKPAADGTVFTLGSPSTLRRRIAVFRPSRV